MSLHTEIINYVEMFEGSKSTIKYYEELLRDEKWWRFKKRIELKESLWYYRGINEGIRRVLQTVVND